VRDDDKGTYSRCRAVSRGTWRIGAGGPRHASADHHRNRRSLWSGRYAQRDP
jgi:hypothetical protein